MASLFENDMLNKIWNNFQSIQQNPMNLVDILLVAFVVYEILVVIRKTRAAQLAKGAVVVLVVYALANLMNLRTVVWIMQSVLQIGFLALIVLFQPELRRALEQMGRTDKWAATLFKNRRDDPSLRAKWQNACLAICDAAEQLSDTRTGALIVLERNSNLSEIIRTGTPLNADVNREMLGTIFYEAWQLSAVTEEQGRERFFSRVFSLYQSLLFCCCAGIVLLCRPLMFLFKANFYEAWQFVPLLTIATLFNCLNQFLNSIYMVEKRSTLSLYTMMAGAVANCALNWLFIPRMGPNGVTLASFLSYLLVFLLRAVNTRGLLRIDFAPVKLVFNGIMVMAEVGLMLFQAPHWAIWCSLLTVGVCAFNFQGVLGMLRQLLGRRGRRA